MAAKKKSKSPSKAGPKSVPNKSAFVRALPSSMPGAEVVSKAKAEGIKISLAYVYGIRAKSKAKRAKTRSGGGVATRGPGRPRKDAAAPVAAVASPAAHRSLGGLVAEIERIVEAKVSEMLKARLGALFK